MRPRPRLSSRWRLLLGGAMTATLAACGTSLPIPPASMPASFLPAASADTGIHGATPRASDSSDASPEARSTPATIHLAVEVLPWRLDVGLSRAVAFADGATVVVAGGLTANGTTGDVRRIDVVTGQTSDIGHLQDPVHDASGAVIGGRLLVFGGGRSVAGSAVQVVSAGTTGHVVGNLPAVRADLSTVVVGNRAFVIGGGSSNGPDPRIWATSDGSGARLVGRLRIGVRYAATAVWGPSIYVFGGASASGDRSEIQRFDTTTGRTTVIGRLPLRLSHAASMVIDGHILVIGGVSSDVIWSFDPGLARLTQVGRLPYAVSDAAAVVIGHRGYLIGGEDQHVLDTVISLELR